MTKRVIVSTLIGLIGIFLVANIALASSDFSAAANHYLGRVCLPGARGVTATLCYFNDLLKDHEQRLSNIEASEGLFPEPNFDSGWIIIPAQTAVIDIPHDVGGDINDYFIDATYRRPDGNGTFMSHQTAADKIWWEDVEPNNIQVATNGNVTNLFEAVRIRIWRLK